MLSTTGDEVHSERQWLARVTDGSTDGVILLVALGQSGHLETLRRRGVPFVVVDHRGELGIDVPSVGAANWAGGRAATEHLLSLGHRRIAVIGGPPSHASSNERVAGYRAALADSSVAADEALVRRGPFDEEAGYVQACALLDLPMPPTAIFAGCDRQAMGVYNAVRDHGLSVPHHISVVGFDDVPLAALVSPALTTVRQPLREMGRVATTMLLRQIAGEPLDSQRVELATTLIVRASTAAPPRMAHRQHDAALALAHSSVSLCGSSGGKEVKERSETPAGVAGSMATE